MASLEMASACVSPVLLAISVLFVTSISLATIARRVRLTAEALALVAMASLVPVSVSATRDGLVTPVNPVTPDSTVQLALAVVTVVLVLVTKVSLAMESVLVRQAGLARNVINVQPDSTDQAVPRVTPVSTARATMVSLVTVSVSVKASGLVQPVILLAVCVVLQSRLLLPPQPVITQVRLPVLHPAPSPLFSIMTIVMRRRGRTLMMRVRTTPVTPCVRISTRLLRALLLLLLL